MTGNLVITIGRECGSGGRLIGNRLAEKLNIKCYDKELLTLAAKKTRMVIREIIIGGDKGCEILFMDGVRLVTD